MIKGSLCRALNTHAWQIFGAIVILRDDNRRITLLCTRCETTRQDVWSIQGKMLTRYYKHGINYSAYIKEYNREGARADLLANTKAVEVPMEKTSGKANNPNMRPAPRGGPSGRKLRAVKRSARPSSKG